ncbi:hypothetical protein AB0K09_03440 [Streptomyces sp. NPDC049577]|uniref:hypothetical protein n=1 Tax=Streptomyces sp. NPDC049577 TaxID=3155153 RepID=UPI00343E6774
MTEVRIIRCTTPTELFRQYVGQGAPQPVYIELDLREGTLLADYDAEVGGAVPFSVFHNFERRYAIPLLTGAAANRVMEQIAPLAERILADWEEVWDGNNKVACLGEDARAAEEQLRDALGLGLDASDREDQGFDEADLVAVWDIDGAVTGGEAEEYDISCDTDDDRLEEIADEIVRDLADVSESGVAVVPGLEEYLRTVREDLIEAAA